MRSKQQKAPDAGQGVEGQEPTTYESEWSSTMSLPSTPRCPRPPLSQRSVTSLILQSNREGRPVTELVAELEADERAERIAARKRADRWGIVGDAVAVLGVTIFGYLSFVGLAAIMTNWMV